MPQGFFVGCASFVRVVKPSYCLANDEGQAADDLELAKKLIRGNAILADAVDIKQKIIERRDGKGFRTLFWPRGASWRPT
jgi:hypothetical protein